MLNDPPVLIICSGSPQREKIVEIVRHIGLQSVECFSLTEARALIEQQVFSFALCNDDLPDCNLRTAVRVLSSATKRIPVIVLSHLADWDACIRALNAGAFDYVVCPPDPVETARILRLALDKNPTFQRAAQTAAWTAT